MKNFKISTLTVNPALDKSTQFSGLIAEQKIRCNTPRYDAGGGGINVSKAIYKLGGESLCVFTSGGSSGEMLEKLVKNSGIKSIIVRTKNWTRENFIGFDTITNAQYRFGFPGNEILPDEEQNLLETIENLNSDYLVLSGSINEGLAPDFYQKIARKAKELNLKIVVDTSGEALKKVLEIGVYLIKPNIGELAKLIGVTHLEVDQVAPAALKIIEQGKAEIVVVSLGPEGAILVSETETEHVPAPKVIKKSTVGAGDSMVGGMIWALAEHKPLKEVIRWGVACGSAATMNEGTQLFKLEDAKNLFAELNNLG